MCLPFSCGGGDKGDDGSHDPNVLQPFRPPQQAPLPPPRAARSDEEDNVQLYNKPSSFPVKEAYGHRATNMPVAVGGEGKNRGACAAQPHVAEVNKNGGGCMMDFGYSDDDVHASVGVVRGRESQSAAGKIVASTTPATQAFNNKHRDLAAAQQAPQRTYVSASASPRHHHGHGSSAALHPSEAADNMKAPLPVLPMARRRGEDY